MAYRQGLREPRVGFGPFEYVDESIRRLREEATQSALEQFIDLEREKAVIEERADD
jgi:hypothetical protein